MPCGRGCAAHCAHAQPCGMEALSTTGTDYFLRFVGGEGQPLWVMIRAMRTRYRPAQRHADSLAHR